MRIYEYQLNYFLIQGMSNVICVLKLLAKLLNSPQQVGPTNHVLLPVERAKPQIQLVSGLSRSKSCNQPSLEFHLHQTPFILQTTDVTTHSNCVSWYVCDTPESSSFKIVFLLDNVVGSGFWECSMGIWCGVIEKFGTLVWFTHILLSHRHLW